MMGVGISGVPGTGKDLLASSYSNRTEHVLLSFSVEELFHPTRSKIEPKSVIKAYHDILSQLESVYLGAGMRFVTDMTPIDVMAEMYSTFTWYSAPTEEADKDIAAAWEYACYICSKYLGVIMHIQPDKCGARMEQLNALTSGLIHTRLVNEVDSSMFTVRRGLVDLETRLEALMNFVHAKYVTKTPCENTSSLKH